MPTYAFGCKNCQHKWEDFLSVNDPIPECPKCKAESVDRLIAYGTAGRVEATDEDIHAMQAKGTKDMIKRAYNDENFMANLVGEKKYHQGQFANERANKIVDQYARKSIRSR
jgi:putative FmdB family regulatory protein